jgi:hypothetical protein
MLMDGEWKSQTQETAELRLASLRLGAIDFDDLRAQLGREARAVLSAGNEAMEQTVQIPSDTLTRFEAVLTGLPALLQSNQQQQGDVAAPKGRGLARKGKKRGPYKVVRLTKIEKTVLDLYEKHGRNMVDAANEYGKGPKNPAHRRPPTLQQATAPKVNAESRSTPGGRASKFATRGVEMRPRNGSATIQTTAAVSPHVDRLSQRPAMICALVTIWLSGIFYGPRGTLSVRAYTGLARAQTFQRQMVGRRTLTSGHTRTSVPPSSGRPGLRAALGTSTVRIAVPSFPPFLPLLPATARDLARHLANAANRR